MNRRQIALGFVALILGLAPVMGAGTPPNILIILVDDMGYSDIGCYGGEIRTPNIDRLAAGGMKFAQMHNTAKCYPTRACLQTGVYFQRTDRDFSNTATLGEVLRPAGYTTLWSGKHHARFNPVTRGYDRFYGSFEGGVATPLVAHWPAVIRPQFGWNRDPVHLVDLMPTVLALTGTKYPGESKETKIPPLDGVSLVPAFKGEPIARAEPLFFQFAKGSAVLDGPWKLVRNSPTWELYDLTADRTEIRDLAAQRPELVRRLDAAWLAWWKDCTGKAWTGTAPRERVEE